MRTHITADEAAPDLGSRGAAQVSPRRCHAELSNDLLDADGAVIAHLIDFAFTTLGVQALDVRVTTAGCAHMLITVQDEPEPAQR